MSNTYPTYKSNTRQHAKRQAERMLARCEKCRNDYPHAVYEITDTLTKKRGKLVNDVTVWFQVFPGEVAYRLAVWQAIK